MIRDNTIVKTIDVDLRNKYNDKINQKYTFYIIIYLYFSVVLFCNDCTVFAWDNENK